MKDIHLFTKEAKRSIFWPKLVGREYTENVTFIWDIQSTSLNTNLLDTNYRLIWTISYFPITPPYIPMLKHNINTNSLDMNYGLIRIHFCFPNGQFPIFSHLLIPTSFVQNYSTPEDFLSSSHQMFHLLSINQIILSLFNTDYQLWAIIKDMLRYIAYSMYYPYLPNGLVHPYQLDESISNVRGVWCTFSFLFYFE